MSKPCEYSALVKNVQFLTKTVLNVNFELIKPAELKSIPGQFINVEVAPGVYRPYSICSSPSDSTGVSIVASVTHNGLGANYLKALKAGAKVSLIGPAGKFGLVGPLPQDVIFVATGTGISPFMSMLASLATTKFPGTVFLYFGVRSSADIFFQKKLDAFKNTLNFDYKICLSQENGRVTKLLKITQPDNCQYYLCGNPQMVADVEDLLSAKGVKANQIFHEKFTVAHK